MELELLLTAVDESLLNGLRTVKQADGNLKKLHQSLSGGGLHPSHAPHSHCHCLCDPESNNMGAEGEVGGNNNMGAEGVLGGRNCGQRPLRCRAAAMVRTEPQHGELCTLYEDRRPIDLAAASWTYPLRHTCLDIVRFSHICSPI